MSALPDGFDRIAPLYDPLKRLVFGKTIFRSSVHFLDQIPADGKVLILGGGTGEILPALLCRKPRCEIWFVDASSEMLRRARNRVGPPPTELHFIHGSENDIPLGITFDAIITSFFLDVFGDEALPPLCTKLASRLSREGVWLASDFVNGGKRWQKTLLRLMYTFFRFVLPLEAKALPRWEKHIKSAGLAERQVTWYYGRFIKSAVYQKNFV